MPKLPLSVVAAMGACVGPVTQAGELSRPNLLWLVSEDNTARFVSAYGDPLARTPTLDRLARQGIVFTNAYCPAPVCAPARSTIITGVSAATLGTLHMRSLQPLPDGVGFFPQHLRTAGYYCTNRAKTDYNTSTSWAGAWDANGPSAHWRGRKPEQPFFAVFNFAQSHESHLHQRQKLTTDPATVRVPPYLPDTPVVRSDLAQYYDCVARADAAIGEVLAQLEADGLADDTIVFYYGDNGGALPRSKRFLYRDGTHVPMIARFPPRYAHLAPRASDGRFNELVTFVDLAPTMLALAGVKPPAHLQGRAFAGVHPEPAPSHVVAFRGRMDERSDHLRALIGPRYHYIRNYRPHLPHGRRVEYLWQQASMREWAELYAAGRLDLVQRAFFELKPAEELFDSRADPDHVRNLASEPGHRDLLQQMRRTLNEQLVATRDLGFLPESLMNELAAGGSPARLGSDETVYPLTELIALIDSCQTDGGGPAALPYDDARAVMRYWAVELSRTQPPAERVSHVRPLLADENASVRVAAAGVLLEIETSDPDAWRTIEQATAPGQPMALRLEAAEIATTHRALPNAIRLHLREANGAEAESHAPGPGPGYLARLLHGREEANR